MPFTAFRNRGKKLMKIIHTSDWHLGQRLFDHHRKEENDLFLDWFSEKINEIKADILIISGDIFDNGNPPQYALKQYYDFLKKTILTSCKCIVIIGGNHDSVSVLNAPGDLLSSFQIFVVGGAELEFCREVLEIKNNEKEIIAIVAAIPFLRDRDIHYTISGESFLERENRVKQGIINHYQNIGELCKKYEDLQIPIIATGHLFTTGAIKSESEKEIYVGNLGQIDANEFPKIFDYIALGHLHRSQKVAGKDYIRYSGSPLSMSFSESGYKHYFNLITFDNKTITNIERIEIPKFRKLVLLKGNLAEIIEKLSSEQISENKLHTWVEIQLNESQISPSEREKIIDLSEESNLELLSLRLMNRKLSWDSENEMDNNLSLSDLDIETVFMKKCSLMKFNDEVQSELVRSFKELLIWKNEQENL